MFIYTELEFETNPYKDLISGTTFEQIARGRQGAILVKPFNSLVPIVRTTTKYSNPAQKFTCEQFKLIEQILLKTKDLDLDFNNGMIELYTCEYKSMGFHTDQALDLESGSYICLFSCYSNDKTTSLRKLVVKNKLTGEETNYTLRQNSIILFDIKTNSQYMHKIILDSSVSQDTWLGITLRKSNTYLDYSYPIPKFPDGTDLQSPDKELEKEFCRLKSIENKQIEFSYPKINYSLSPSDWLHIKS
jgi:hypothetical protein